jgi:hypothetical protein
VGKITAARALVRVLRAEGVDTLFITGGLAAKDTKTDQQPDPAALETYLAQEQVAPTYSIGFLR